MTNVADQYVAQLQEALAPRLMASRPQLMAAGTPPSGAGGDDNACTDYSAFLNDLTSTCIPGASTQNASKCAATLASVVGAPCGELKCLAGIANVILGSSNEQMCAEIDKGIQTLNTPAAAQNAAGVIPWFNETAAPCFESMCATTAHPVKAAAIRAAPRTFLRNAVEAQLSAPERFLLHYWWLVGIVVFIIVLAIVIALLLRNVYLGKKLALCRSLCPTTAPVTVSTAPASSVQVEYVPSNASQLVSTQYVPGAPPLVSATRVVPTVQVAPAAAAAVAVPATTAVVQR